MALWGDKDTKATGTVTIVADSDPKVGTATATATKFNTTSTYSSTLGNVGEYIVVGSDRYLIVSITSGTVAKVKSGVDGTNIVPKTSQSFTFIEAPAFVAASESSQSDETDDPPYGVHGDSTKVYGVDVNEALVDENADRGVNTPGWVRYTTYTDSAGNTRHKSEVLVAIKTITGDAADDAVAENLVITIDTDPESQAIDSGDDVTLEVIASINGNAVLTYQWYDASTDDPVTGATGSTLTLEGVTDPASYYVIVSANGVLETSATADITINP